MLCGLLDIESAMAILEPNYAAVNARRRPAS
jgi:hypothetical protein